MVEPISLGIAIAFLVKSAPGWFHTLQDTLLSKGKDSAIEQGKQKITGLIDEKKHLHRMELALKNAAERGLRQFRTLEERDQYRSILEILAEGNSETLRREAMQLFTLSDNPDLTELTEKYNLRQRISALAQHQIHEEVDAAAYLNSFFEGLMAELYNDPLFRGQMSDVIRVRAALVGQRTWEDIRTILSQIYNKLADDYTEERFQQEVETYLEYVEMKFRRHNFSGIVFKGDEDKAPDLENIFVPLRIASRSQSTSQEKVRDDLSSMFEQSPYLVLLGGPGSGKSTLTRYIASSHAKANLTPTSVPTAKNPILLAGQPVPLRIELRLLSDARKKHNGGFLSYATEVMLREEDISIHTQMFIELLERKMMLVLFDGLDEVPTLSERRQLIEQVENFAQRYPGNHIMVTSRPVGYEIASFTNPWFIHSEVQEFNDEQIHAFLEGWYKYVLKFPFLTGEVRRELDMFYTTVQNNSRLHKLATNPLLLTVMAALHRYKRLPDKRVELYAECAELLLDTWARLKYKEPHWKDMKMGKTNQRDCIAHLGLFLHTRSQEHEENDADARQKSKQSAEDAATDVPAEDMQREIERYLKSENLLSGAEINAEAERFLDLVKTEAGLIVERGTDERGPLYGFVHRTFQEYFAAVAVFEQSKQEDDPAIISDFLKEHLHDPHWNEVILLLIGQLRHKQVTALLRRILKGEIKSRRSIYTDIVQQDLLFICTCLAEEVLVEKDFAEDVISRLSDLVENSSFPSLRTEALEVFGALIRTRQYGNLGQQKLKTFVIEESLLDIVTRVQAAQALYQSSSKDSDERRLATQMLLALAQRSDLSFEQVIQVLYQNSPKDSDEQRLATQMLLALAQRPDLSFEQVLQVAQALYQSSSKDSDEQRLATQMLLALAQRPDLSFEQVLQAAQVLYRISPRMSKEKEQASEILSDLIQQPNLSIEQTLQVAEVLYQSSYKDWGNEQLASHTLLALTQRSNLSFEQTLQVAKTLYGNSVSDQEIKQQATQILLTLTQHPNISFEQSLQAAQALYRANADESNEIRFVTQMLLALVQRPDLSFEQQVQAAQALYRCSAYGSDEMHLATQLLLTLLQRSGLSFECALQAAQALYMCSEIFSNEQHFAIQALFNLAQNQQIAVDQRLQATTEVLETEFVSFLNKAQAIQIVFELLQEEIAIQYLEKHWIPIHDEIKPETSEIPCIVELTRKKALPGALRDEMYQTLRGMVPQFDKSVEPNE